VRELVRKADGYGIPGVRVDGNDVLAVHAAVSAAAARARRGEGPTFVECVTFRMGGHSSSDDPTRYRSGEAVEAWKARDPVVRFRRYLEGRGLWSEARETQANERWNARIGEAIKVAEAMPPPAVESIFDGVYAELPWNLREQRAWLTAEGGGHAKDEGRFPL
jgi:pyruvate dehydrogenase E1 component alpha subunit/2-oxoisovalerate dehydrogenase E1 component alpha subunit